MDATYKKSPTRPESGQQRILLESLWPAVLQDLGHANVMYQPQVTVDGKLRIRPESANWIRTGSHRDRKMG
jgi:hypothetical protein